MMPPMFTSVLLPRSLSSLSQNSTAIEGVLHSSQYFSLLNAACNGKEENIDKGTGQKGTRMVIRR